MDYKPLSREFLLQRGHCCDNNCLNCPYKDNDMKTEKQDKDSMMNYIIGVIGMILTVIMVLALNSTSSQKQEYQDIETELLNEMEIHWDSVNKETKDWTGTTQGYNKNYFDEVMLGQEDWVCGGDYEDTVSRYDNFNEVPAGTETLVIVDGILYKVNDNKTLWTPVYPDEYMMWVGSNGDTIWE